MEFKLIFSNRMPINLKKFKKNFTCKKFYWKVVMKRLYIRSIQVELLNNLFEKVRKDEVSTDILDNGKQNKNLHKNFNQIF